MSNKKEQVRVPSGPQLQSPQNEGFAIKENTSITKAAVKAALFEFQKVRKMKKTPPFKPAELVIPAETAKDQRWYILFHVYHAHKGKVVRKRFYKIPDVKPPSMRKALAEKICHHINLRLENGEYIGQSKYTPQYTPVENSLPEPEPELIFVSSAVQNINESKKDLRLRTQQSNETFTRVFIDYLKKTKRDKPISQWSVTDCTEFLNWSIIQGKKPRTCNNYLLFLRHIWKLGIKMQYTTTNPWLEITRKKIEIGKNIAYLPHQQKEIIHQAAQRPQILLLIKMVYYTLARSNEIASLKVKDITDKIYLHASHSKNGYERWMVIPEGLEDEFIKQGIRKLPPDWYIFSKNKLLPGPTRARTRDLGEKYRQYVLTPLGYTTMYTLYSWKHTGVIAAHKAGVSDDDIMLQTGHKNYGSFQVYLKSLGLFENETFASKIPKL